MARRCSVPAWMLMALLALSVAGPHVIAQEKPAKEPPKKSAEGTKPAAKSDAKTAAKAAPAQKQPAKTAPAKTAAKPDKAAARAEFEAKFAQWKGSFKKLRTLRHDFQTADEAGREKLKQQWSATLAEANAMLSVLADSAAKAYAAAPNQDRELTSFLVKLLQDYVARDQYQKAVDLGKVLIDNDCDMPQIYRDIGIANMALHNFDVTEEMFGKAEEANALSSGSDADFLKKSVAEYKEFWKEEQETRAKEAKADDLPRVKLTTSKGDIVVELFENEAPDTVGNFISLVKKGFYDGLTFHRVVAGFMAQGGCPEGDGSGGPGYRIYDEYDKPNSRKHFRGVLSMAKTKAANSGGSQFFITFRPTPNLNGAHTVFGRVIEGMDVVTRLQRVDPTKEDQPDPDKIIKAEVLRCRDHEYLPNKVE